MKIFAAALSPVHNLVERNRPSKPEICDIFFLVSPTSTAFGRNTSGPAR